MSRNNRKKKSAIRRRRRKKKSKLFAAVVIELLAAIALFSTYQSAQEYRASQRAKQTDQATVERPQPVQVQRIAPWDRLVSAASPAQRSAQAPVFRPSRLIGFLPEGS